MAKKRKGQGLLYRLRRRIFLWSMPKRLTVVFFDGAEYAPGTGLFDPDTMRGWGSVKIQWVSVCSRFEVHPVSERS